MRPDYHRAIIDTVQYYKWKKIIYLYDSHDGKFSTSSISHFIAQNLLREGISQQADTVPVLTRVFIIF